MFQSRDRVEFMMYLLGAVTFRSLVPSQKEITKTSRASAGAKPKFELQRTSIRTPFQGLQLGSPKVVTAKKSVGKRTALRLFDNTGVAKDAILTATTSISSSAHVLRVVRSRAEIRSLRYELASTLTMV